MCCHQALEDGGGDAALAFALKGGYELVLSYLACSPILVSSILVNLWGSSTNSAASGREQRQKCMNRWPSWVVGRLMSMALEGFPSSGSDPEESAEEHHFEMTKRELYAN